jgi:crossover junction endodeoxyribonuclease RuvC
MMGEQTRRIIGFDPGLRVTGWGVIEVVRGKLIHIANGSVKSNTRLSLAERLLELDEGLRAVLMQWQPLEASVEKSFVNKDGSATLKLGQARAISLLAPARFGVSVAEYSPNEVKKTVAGAGHADKRQILAMLSMLLPKAEIANEHAADALAIAICHAHMTQNYAARVKAVL